MVKISYVYKKQTKKNTLSRILLFHSEIGWRELQTL